ncbi:unannotated protein [freshwater metagenome]|uniref:Unannotated protein n=1 Tax=freshwater metagenome TaxID=449393 RepID=A0A6J7XS46_9ZZZZ|nr:TetR family transcriptional regulator [Actinomycetota bacterium]
MPRIETSDLASHRDWRRAQLIEAASSIALESGGAAITVAAVATRAGLSRTSVYEYFGSSAELTADLVIEELHGFALILKDAVKECTEPFSCIQAWIEAALTYISDGRHLLAKALNATSTPANRAMAIGQAHRALLAPLKNSLVQAGVVDIDQALAFIQSITDAATKRIEAGRDAQVEITTTTTFCINGLRALVS